MFLEIPNILLYSLIEEYKKKSPFLEYTKISDFPANRGAKTIKSKVPDKGGPGPGGGN